MRLKENDKLQEDASTPSEIAWCLEERKAMQTLVEVGLMKEIKPRNPESNVEYTPVPIQGKPLSETIVEERR